MSKNDKFHNSLGEQDAKIFNVENCRICQQQNNNGFDPNQLQQAQKADLQMNADELKKGTIRYKEYKAIPLAEQENAMAEQNTDSAASALAPPSGVGGLYFYHPDHLGTSTALTDYFGKAYQFFLNLPFGETMAQQLGSNYYNSPYKFNGKELDEETGLYYYGARYYSPRESIWLSVDPLAEKYPSFNPYAYCINNPLNIIDPDGQDIIFAKNASAEFKANFKKSIAYLKANKVDGIFAKLQASKVVYVIEEGNKNTSFDPSNNTITWDDNHGIKTSEGEFLSPITLLNHEADHALQEDNHPIKKIIDKILPSKYDNKEEERVITGSEQRTAKALGEIKKKDGVTRKDHKGTYIKTEGPTSNVPVKTNEKPRKKENE